MPIPLFRKYGEMLQSLAGVSNGKVQESDLRRFEKPCCKELGYGLMLDHDASGQAVSADALAPIAWNTALAPESCGRIGTGDFRKTLLDLAAENFDDPRTRIEAKSLMRTLMNYYLAGRNSKPERYSRSYRNYDDRTRGQYRPRRHRPPGTAHVRTGSTVGGCLKPIWGAPTGYRAFARGSPAYSGCRRPPVEGKHQIKLNFEMAATGEMVAFACGIKPKWPCWSPKGGMR